MSFRLSFPFLLNFSGYYKIMSSKAAKLYLYLWIHENAVNLENDICKIIENKFANFHI